MVVCSEAAEPEISDEMTMVVCPFVEKDEVKRLGAKWDARERSWFVPAGLDLAPFQRWRKDCRIILHTTSQEDDLLLVKRGARFDGNNWYITTDMTLENFSCWLYDDDTKQQ